jgi:hypothetical protein
MKLKSLDHDTLVALNDSSIRAGFKQNLRPDRISHNPQPRYLVNLHRETQHWIRISVVLDVGGRTAWLDVSRDEFESIPIIEVSDHDWGAAMCAGTPPPMP